MHPGLHLSLVQLIKIIGTKMGMFKWHTVYILPDRSNSLLYQTTKESPKTNLSELATITLDKLFPAYLFSSHNQ